MEALKVAHELNISKSQLYLLISKYYPELEKGKNGRYIDFPSDLIDEISKKIKGKKKKENKKEEPKVFKIQNRRYLGNKFKILQFIRHIVDEHCPDVNSVFDVFAGSGSVSSVFLDKKIIANDILYSNYVSLYAWFSPEKYDKAKIKKYLGYFNTAEIEDDNYFSENFAGTYFSLENCKKIGFIRECLENLKIKKKINFKEFCILLTSLMYAMDKIANTCGHYDAWRKNTDLNKSLILYPLQISESLNGGNEIYREDGNRLVRKISADLVYIDPPYNSRQYCDTYHLLENIATWEKKEVHGVARKIERRDIKSKYCTNEATKYFADLIDNIDAKYILLSYNNMAEKGNARSNAKISDDDIMGILSRHGKVEVFSTSYRAFSAGKSFHSDNEERLFLCTVDKKDKDRRYIASPLNYTGGKYRIIEELNRAFPTEIDTFMDLFAGGANVAVNVKARKYVINDSERALIDLLRYLHDTPVDIIIKDVESIIVDFNLSQSDIHGYEYYLSNSSQGLAFYNREAFLKLRKAYNEMPKDDIKRSLYLFVLITYSFNNQIRFNNNGDFNLPVGKRDFNSRLKGKLVSFCSRLKNMDVMFSSKDFRELDIPSNTFVYADPPYLITNATYNERNGWSEKDELDLLSFLEDFDEKGGQFALSNILVSRNRENTILKKWLESHPKFKVIHIDRSYANSNYHIKDKKAISDEILVINY